MLHVQMPGASRVAIPASPVSGTADQIAAAAAVTMFMHAAAPAQLACAGVLLDLAEIWAGLDR